MRPVRPTALTFFRWATPAVAALIWAGSGHGERVSAQRIVPPDSGNAVPGRVADPPDLVVHLHYDYMVAADHTHEPDPAAITIVVEAFRRQGITLHIDPIHHAIPERQVVTLANVANWTDPACSGPDAVTVEDLRATYLPPHANGTWHYAVFGHQAVTPDATHALACDGDRPGSPRPLFDATGIAELPGLNFAVTFGVRTDTMEPIGIELSASTFMHELGHNFGLSHGGSLADEGIIDKPNYISVMSPMLYQLNGIPVADAPGSTNLLTCTTDRQCGPPTVVTGACATRNACHCTDLNAPILGFNYCFRTDYSSQELPALNELSPNPGIGGLDENVGVSGSPGDTDIVLWFTPGGSGVLSASNGSPIDWNNDGSIGTHVQADINHDNFYTSLRGFNDWAYLHALLNTPDYKNGVVRQDRRVISCGERR